MSSSVRSFYVIAASLVLCLGTVNNGEAAEQKVLLIGIDGCRFDAVRATETPHLDGLIDAGMVDDRCQILGERYQGSDTSSGPGWSSILTGVWADKHGVNDNEFENPKYKEYPHFFRRLKDVRPDAMTISIADWAPIHEHIVTAADVQLTPESGEVYVSGDQETATDAVRLLTETDPTAMFVYFGQVDETGHKHGFHPSVPEYVEAIQRVDRHVGEVLRAMEARPNFAGEDWLVLVTSDHGGRGTRHGGGHGVPEIINSFFIVSGPAVQRGEIRGTTELVDVAPTALTHLGVKIDLAWGFDGRAVGLPKSMAR